MCPLKHNHKAEKCLQSHPVSGNNPVHNGQEAGQCGQEALFLLLALWHLCQQKKLPSKGSWDPDKTERPQQLLGRA